MKKVNGHKNQGKLAVEQVAQQLANLLGKPVAGKTPDPIHRDDPSAEEILIGLLLLVILLGVGVPVV